MIERWAGPCIRITTEGNPPQIPLCRPAGHCCLRYCDPACSLGPTQPDPTQPKLNRFTVALLRSPPLASSCCSMKLLAPTVALAAAVLALLTCQSKACPTLRLTTKAKRFVRDNKLISVAISAKVTGGTTPANDVQIAVRGSGLRPGGHGWTDESHNQEQLGDGSG